MWVCVHPYTLEENHHLLDFSKRKQKFTLIALSHTQEWHIALFSLNTTWREIVVLLKLIQVRLEFLQSDLVFSEDSTSKQHWLVLV